MEVSQIKELDTHAVIGGGKAQAFRMSESAEFFTVLSDTLYRDKKRAVIREIICNGWDAHLIIGIDTPLEITLTETELRIRDFGPGIPHNKVGDIYCVYGASTKVKNDNQTGGFGLGSKAPFAYSDHFSVMSHHDGRKRVYAISRGGAETEGKPDFREMVNVPTTEQGICVSIPLKSPEDMHEFANIIRSVVRYGGMNVKLNGALLETVDYSKATHGFIVVPATHDLGESRVYCRYGTVIYPVMTQDRQIVTESNELAGLFSNSARVILLAKPNTVGVTPSRESLSYTDRTTETLRALIAGASKLIKNEMKRWVKPMLEDAAKRIVDKIEKQVKRDTVSTDTIWNRPITSRDAEDRLNAKVAHMTLEDMSRCAAAFNMESLVRNQTKKTRLAFSKVAGPARSLFRRAAYGPMEKRTRYGELYHKAMDQFRFDSRLFRRMACDLDIMEYLFVGTVDGHSYDYCVKKLTRLSSFSRSSHIKYHLRYANEIWIGNNHRDIINALASRKLNPAYDSAHCVMALVLPKKLNGRMKEITDRLKKMNITINEVAYTDPPKKLTKKEIKAEENGEVLYYCIDDISNNGSLPKTTRQSTLVSDAKYYLRVNPDFRYYVYPSFAEAQRGFIRKTFGKIILVDDAKEEDLLKKQGLRDICFGLSDEVMKFKGNKAALYGLVYKSFIAHGEYGKFSALLQDLINMDIEYAYKFFPLPEKDRDNDVGEKIASLTGILDAIWRNTTSTRAKEAAKAGIDAYGAMKKEAREVFKHYFLDKKSFKERFGYLDIIAGVQYHLRYSDEKSLAEQKESLTEIFDFLSRKNKMKIKVRKKQEEEAAAKLPIPASRALVLVSQPIAATPEIVSETAEATKEAA